MELNQALIRHGTACARSPTHILTDVHPSNDHRYGALGPIRAAYRRVGRGTGARPTTSTCRRTSWPSCPATSATDSDRTSRSTRGGGAWPNSTSTLLGSQHPPARIDCHGWGPLSSAIASSWQRSAGWSVSSAGARRTRHHLARRVRHRPDRRGDLGRRGGRPVPLRERVKVRPLVRHRSSRPVDRRRPRHTNAPPARLRRQPPHQQHPLRRQHHPATLPPRSTHLLRTQDHRRQIPTRRPPRTSDTWPTASSDACGKTKFDDSNKPSPPPLDKGASDASAPQRNPTPSENRARSTPSGGSFVGVSDCRLRSAA